MDTTYTPAMFVHDVITDLGNRHLIERPILIVDDDDDVGGYAELARDGIDRIYVLAQRLLHQYEQLCGDQNVAGNADLIDYARSVLQYRPEYST